MTDLMLVAAGVVSILVIFAWEWRGIPWVRQLGISTTEKLVGGKPLVFNEAEAGKPIKVE